MSFICPTVTPSTPDPHIYREQIERVAPLTDRIQIDLMDGDFAPNKNTNPIQVWWPKGTIADIHLMFRAPAEHIETLVSLNPHMVIIHAESEGDLMGIISHLHKFDIKVGIALLKETTPESVRELIAAADHVLIFSGNLGHFGGQADLRLLDKVPQIREIHAGVEVGWDGGANESNVAELAAGGIDVINVGGALQRSEDPKNAYDTLVAKLANN